MSRADEWGSVLVVEDDRTLRTTVASAVERAGYQVTTVGDGLAAAEMLRAQQFDVVLLDLGLPFVDGWHILATLEGRRVPSVIVISARGEERDKVRALDMGADDYLAKPFGAEELIARVRAVLRRGRPPAAEAEPSRVVQCGDVSVDLGTHTVLRGGVEVRLSPTEYLLLAELARNAGAVMDHRTLLQRVWGPTYAGEMGYLRAFAHRLRAKLEDDPAHPTVVVTVGRQGYRFGPARPA
jgi:two-component system, OmpR family, KDP operon response regulator KdpE